MNRIWQLLTILLIVCNLGLLVTLWLKPGHPPIPPKHESPKEFLSRELQLTPVQQTVYDSLVNGHHSSMQQLQEQGKHLRDQLFQTLVDTAKFGAFGKDSLIGLIATNQSQIERTTYDHLLQVRSICSNEQKKKFDEILTEMLRRLSHPGPGGPPDGNNPPPPPPDAGSR